jgi:hypothetical protein
MSDRLARVTALADSVLEDTEAGTKRVMRVLNQLEHVTAQAPLSRPHLERGIRAAMLQPLAYAAAQAPALWARRSQ